MIVLALIGCADVVWNSRFVNCNGMDAIGYGFRSGPGSRTPSLSADPDDSQCGALAVGLAWAHHEVGDELELELGDDSITFDGLLVEDVEALYLHHGGQPNEAPALYVRWAEFEPNGVESLDDWGGVEELTVVLGPTPGSLGITVTETEVVIACSTRCSVALSAGETVQSVVITTGGDAPSTETVVEVAGRASLQIDGPDGPGGAQVCARRGITGLLPLGALLTSDCEEPLARAHARRDED